MSRRSRSATVLVWAGVAISGSLAYAIGATHFWTLEWWDADHDLRFATVPGGFATVVRKSGIRIWSVTPPQGWVLVATTYAPTLWIPRMDVDRGDVTVSVPIWVVLLPVASLTAALAWQNRRPRPGFCQKCGYDLTGNLSGRCPECGDSVHFPPQRVGQPL